MFPCGKRWMVFGDVVCGQWKMGRILWTFWKSTHTHIYIYCIYIYVYIYIHGFHMACKKSTVCFALRCFSSLLLTRLVAFEGKKTCSTTVTFVIWKASVINHQSINQNHQPTNGFLSQTKKDHLNKTCRYVAFCKDVVRKMTIKWSPQKPCR